MLSFPPVSGHYLYLTHNLMPNPTPHLHLSTPTPTPHPSPLTPHSSPPSLTPYHSPPPFTPHPPPLTPYPPPLTPHPPPFTPHPRNRPATLLSGTLPCCFFFKLKYTLFFSKKVNLVNYLTSLWWPVVNETHEKSGQWRISELLIGKLELTEINWFMKTVPLLGTTHYFVSMFPLLSQVQYCKIILQHF